MAVDMKTLLLYEAEHNINPFELQEAVKQYKVLTDNRTPRQKEVDRFLDLLEHGQPKKWAKPLVWLLRKVVLG